MHVAQHECPGVPPCSGVFAAYHLLRRPNRADTHAALLGLFAAVLVNAVATNGIKIMVRGLQGIQSRVL
jgi:hypothetical protein